MASINPIKKDKRATIVPASEITYNNGDYSGSADSISGYGNADLIAGGNGGNGNPGSDGNPFDYGGYPFGGGYGYGGYGYGGGGGGKSPEEQQEENQDAINTLSAIHGPGRGKDLSEQGEEGIRNIESQIKQNENLYNQTRRNNMRSLEWQPQQQREQSTLSALRARMGNSAYGSSIVDLQEGMNRVDDMADNQLIKTWKDNSDNNYANYFQTANDLWMDKAEYVNNIKDEFSKLKMQYWAALSNINPKLATKENIEKAMNGESVSIGEGTDYYTLPDLSDLKPSESLQELFKLPERPSAVNPYTREFVRPDRAVNAALRIPNTGTRNQSTAANQGFNDNLNVYQRRV